MIGILNQNAEQNEVNALLKQLEDMIQKRNKEKQNRLKLYYVCGIMVGAMLTILLV